MTEARRNYQQVLAAFRHDGRSTMPGHQVLHHGKTPAFTSAFRAERAGLGVETCFWTAVDLGQTTHSRLLPGGPANATSPPQDR
jgi:hypothetical protein